MTIREYIEGLSRWEHRGSTTDNERQAAEYIKDEMTSLGLEARLEHFVSQTSFSWVYIIIYGVFLVAGLLGLFYPFWGLVLGSLALALFVGECTSKWKAAASVLPKKPSQNALGILKNEAARKKLIFVSHYDSSKSGLSFHPSLVGSFRSSFITSVVMKIILLQTLLINCFGGWGWTLFILQMVATAYMLLPIGLLLHRELFGRYVQGASDNASGVGAMLGVAEKLAQNPPKNFEAWFLATGCEEVNLIGMSAFMRAHQYEIDRDTTYFINMDNLGGGSLRYVTGEGMLKVYPSSTEMVCIAEKLASLEEFSGVEAHEYRLATLDALVASSRGYKVLSLMGMDEGDGIPNWHWPTDTLENVDFALAEQGADFASRVVSALDE
jgi:hypothetical protein